MRTYRTNRGPFATRPHYKLAEIDRICGDHLLQAGLLNQHEPRRAGSLGFCSRSIARSIVAVDEAGDPEPGEEPADVLSGGVYSSGDYLLCEIDWIDRPSPGEVTQLLEAAADAVDAAA